MKKDRRSTILECWRPPTGAGDPVGCLATTFTFDSGFFEEECLTRFLNIDSHPDREGLAFLLERENMLGSIYAGVFVDHRQAGVDHSLRWDILPVRIPGRYQHSKLALLAWSKYIRILISSGNLTSAGYRNNQEAVGFIDLSQGSTDHKQFDASCSFIYQLIKYVPTREKKDPVLERVKTFIEDIKNYAGKWSEIKPRKRNFSVSTIFTLPNPNIANDRDVEKLNGGNALNGCLDACIRYGGAPSTVKVASPFFNQDSQNGKRDEVMAHLCKRMARGIKRSLTFCVPTLNTEGSKTARLAAPKALFNTAIRQVNDLTVEGLPHVDQDKNFRPWHAKMIRLENDQYAALMIGSSNFTSPAMGLQKINNTEANILYITPKKAHSKQINQLYQCWPETVLIDNPDAVEWTGMPYSLGEENVEDCPALPEGFLSAHYIAGKAPKLSLHFLQEKLPDVWQVYGDLRYDAKVFDDQDFLIQKRPSTARIELQDGKIPGKLLVRWENKQAFWPVNVANAEELPLAPEIKKMTVHDLFCILSAHHYGLAFRAWARQQAGGWEEEELDCAIPAELDPLKRFRLQETFLHRIRARARMLAGIRKNLERPVWSEKALRWRLEGLIGIGFLAEKMMVGLNKVDGAAVEAVLGLSDFFIMLSEVKYQGGPGAVPLKQFNLIYRAFLGNLLTQAKAKVDEIKRDLPRDIRSFWIRVTEQCMP